MRLPDSIAEHRPDPLGSQVQRSTVNGENVNTTADRIAILSGPPTSLPSRVRSARQAIDKAESDKDAAEAKLAAEMASWERYQAALDAIDRERNEISETEGMLAIYQQTVSSFPDDFALHPNWARSHGWPVVHNSVQNLIVAERMIQILPPWIATAKTKLAKDESDAAKLKRDGGF
jgi:hypothetical protein